MRKRFLVPSLTMAVALLLTGCSGEPAEKSDEEKGHNPTLSTEIKMPVENPLTAPIDTPVQTYDLNGITLDVMFAGVGYPNTGEYDYLTGVTETYELTQDNLKLKEEGRVIAVAYTFTNNTSEPLELQPTTWESPNINGEPSTWVSSEASLAALAGYPVAPIFYGEEEVLAPGESATYSLIALLPESARNVDSSTYVQTVNFNGQPVDVEFTFSSKEREIIVIDPNKKEENGEEQTQKEEG